MPLTGSRWDIRWLIALVERSRLSVYFLYLAWRLWKSVVTLAVTGNTVSGRVFGVIACRCFSGIECR
jgi:hypothetical protein